MIVSDTVARAADDIERAHLRDPADRSFVIHRYPAPAELAGLLRRFWVPVWDVPPGRSAQQRVLQYPVCLLVATPGYSRFAGPVRGLSTATLEGRSWGFGAMFAPAAGRLLLGGPVAGIADRFVELDDVFAGLAQELRQAMMSGPDDPAAHARGRALVEARLWPLLPLDEESRLTNELVELVESDSSVTRVGQLCLRYGIGERALERLCRRRLGLTPLWLIRRRRLHEAADRLRDGTAALAQVAADLGYADQAHFSRDFKQATGMTPGRFARMSSGG